MRWTSLRETVMEDATEEFKPVATRLRNANRRFVYAFASFFLCIPIAFILPKDLIPFALIPAFIAFAIAFGIILSSVFMRPCCPRCKQSIYKLGTFCPECGGKKLVTSSLHSSHYCLSCNKEIVLGGKNRRQSFKLRVCSQCGVLLDNAGL